MIVRKTLTSLVFLALLALAIPAGAAHHEGGSAAPAVSNVLIFDVGADTAKFLAFTERARKLQASLGSPGVQRVWVASFGGPQPGAVIVTVEYPSLVAFAAAQEKANASAEWQAFVDEVQAAGMRLMSNAVLTDATR